MSELCFLALEVFRAASRPHEDVRYIYIYIYIYILIWWSVGCYLPAKSHFVWIGGDPRGPPEEFGEAFFVHRHER